MRNVMPQDPKRASLAAPIAVLATVVLCIVALNSLHIVPRFDYQPLNYGAAIILAIALPCTLFWLASRLRSGAWRWTVALFAFVISLPIGLFAIAASAELMSIAQSGVDEGFLQISELKERNSRLSLYRTNGGATTSFGIVLRRETPIVPGLKLVTVIHNFYPAHDATLELLPSGLVRVTVAPYGSNGKAEVREVSP